MRKDRIVTAFLALALVLLSSAAAWAEVPYPGCQEPGCSDPKDFASYLFRRPGELPNDFDPSSSSNWKYKPIIGMNVLAAWRVSTGRPDVVVAVLDSGIRWNRADLARKVALNVGELPVPKGCASHDCNGDGVVNVEDYRGVADHNGNGILDAQDLLKEYSDGVDDDGNGYVDDIAGWDFFQGDNDPDDDVDFGHGTGEADDGFAEANNGEGTPGFAPSAMFVPLRVGDSFVALGNEFSQAVVYAVDRKVSVISEALGALTASPDAQSAIDYAYRRGIPIVASAADEEARHHNYPSGFEHTLWVNSVVNGDGVIAKQKWKYDLLNGCTNYGGRAWVAISSNSCSSEATAREAGLVALLVSRGKNLIDEGKLDPYPGLATPFSAEEIRQLMRESARDVDHEEELDGVSMLGAVSRLLSAPSLGLSFGSKRFPTQAGWDQYTGYGRPDALRLLLVRPQRIPPEADLSGSLEWFDTVDPSHSPQVPIVGSAAAVRAGGSFDYVVEAGCGIQPKEFVPIGAGHSARRLSKKVLAKWHPAETAAACGFDPRSTIDDPDAHTVTLRLRVVDRRGNLGEDRRTVAIHTDTALKRPPVEAGSSLESSPVLADVDRDGVLDVVYASSDGRVHAIHGDTGAEIAGFPARTDPIAVHPSPAYTSHEVERPHEAILAPLAADDLDGDGHVEIVAASIEGRLYVFDDRGRTRPGFPVATDPRFSDPGNRNRLNDADPGILSAPTLADLDAPEGDGALEILAAALDGHLYAWDNRGAPVPGFPVRIADPSKVDIDPATGVARPKPGVDARERAAKLVSSPAVGDLDGDGRPEIVLGSNEEYGGEAEGLPADTRLVRLLNLLGRVDVGLGDELSLDVRGRVYAVQADGNLHPGGPFRPGWPAPVILLAPGVLPTIGTGTPGSPALADLDGSGRLSVAIFGTAGPVQLYDADGEPLLGTLQGRPRVLAMDFAEGFPNVPSSAGSADAPFFGVLGSGAFGDLDGDGLPEYVAPTGGLRKLLDVAAPASQTFGDHQITAWNPRDGSLLDAFPRPMDDMQFLSSPAIADVDGDGTPEIVQGSASYLLRAYRLDGSEPPGWPKFTHGWLIASPTVGDVDGDGLNEVVALTREGHLYIWDTDAPTRAESIPWQGFGRDRRNSQNLSSGVSPLGRR
jgi:Subtilase family/FG-GAP repeat